ncbi:class I SAM-dependent methyltransferase [Desulfobulbus rhabdoformis]|uniref:class I SAM-dependent methyltransferase n=1 Tax=Desulfobulbus rhabdoformis TaxID=34032 RepID=UPI0019640710|nr:class I SAM-dependent methyltransferase [Desulfobulbus rhabdoformis]MBM9616588.1 class I SAM-dependent methyltransferase [Desulfobulbus rhabdoformis]
MMKEPNVVDLSSILLKDSILKCVEPDIYSVLPDESWNEYDSKFGLFYDLVACNPFYNRIVWGYSTQMFSKLVDDALHSASDGPVLDIGCGSLAFTKNEYSQYKDRLVVLSDQSIAMLRMAKERLIKINGKIPDNLLLLHADALNLPFQDNSFKTIISENLLHCPGQAHQNVLTRPS